MFPFSFSYSSSGARFPSLLRRHQGRRSVSPRPRLFAFCVPFSASSGGRGRVDLVSRGRVGRGASRRGSDGLASFFFLGCAIDDGRGAPRACVRLCRCLSTTPEARKAMPLKGVGGTHSPSNTSSPSNALLARTCARSTRSLFAMTRSDETFLDDSAALRCLRGAALVSPRAGDVRDRTPAGLDARNASHRPAVKPSSRRVERARSCPRQLENMAGSEER